MGFSDDHSSLVANVRHLTTGFVSPQYHLVFDDLFQTMFRSGYDDALVDTICNNLFEYNRDAYAEEEFDSSGQLIYHPQPLDEVWLDETERRDQRECLRCQRDITEEREQSKWLRVPVPTFPPEPLGADEGAIPPLMVVSDSDDDDSDHSLHHSNREKSMQQMEILVVTLVVILMMFLILVIILVWMSMTLLNMSV